MAWFQSLGAVLANTHCDIAASRAQREGIITHLLRGDHPNGLLEIVGGKTLGTQIGGRK